MVNKRYQSTNRNETEILRSNNELKIQRLITAEEAMRTYPNEVPFDCIEKILEESKIEKP
jgi:hypothetical protein